MISFNHHMLRLLNMAAAKGPGSRVLDCGCGDGRVAHWLADRGLKVTAFDRVIHEGWPCVAASGVHLLKADIHKVAIRGSFDVVTLFGLLHYAHGKENLYNILRQSRNWLKQDGLLLVNWITDHFPHVDPLVYLPSIEFVERILRESSLTLACSWTADVEHAHGGPQHKHRVAYAAWECQSTSSPDLKKDQQ